MNAAEVLQPAIIYLGAGLAAALASRAVRLSPIVGYLVAGVVIGPSGFALVHDNDTDEVAVPVTVSPDTGPGAVVSGGGGVEVVAVILTPEAVVLPVVSLVNTA